jgi:hypothetical protein
MGANPSRRHPQASKTALSQPPYRRGEHGQLAPHEGEQEAIRQMVALRAKGKALRAIAEAMKAKGFKISHEGVKGVLAAHRTSV